MAEGCSTDISSERTPDNTGPPVRVAYGAPRPNRPNEAGFGQQMCLNERSRSKEEE